MMCMVCMVHGVYIVCMYGTCMCVSMNMVYGTWCMGVGMMCGVIAGGYGIWCVCVYGYGYGE